MRGLIKRSPRALQDSLVENQTLAGLRTVQAPKTLAALHLLRELGPSACHAIVLFGSIAGSIGSAGQANYAAANAGLDTIASLASEKVGVQPWWRWASESGVPAVRAESHVCLPLPCCSQGIPSCSVAWGAWESAGMAAKQRGVAARLERLGIASIPARSGLAALQAILRNGGPPTLVVAVLLWDRLLIDGREKLHFYSQFARGPWVSRSAGPVDARVAVSVLPSPAKAPLLQPDIASMVERIVSQSVGRSVGVDEPLVAAGLDSLGAVEVRRELAAVAGIDLPSTLIFDYPTIANIAAHILEVMPVDAPPLAVVAAASGVPAGRPSALAIIQEAVGRIIGDAVVSDTTPLMSAGLDSLGAVELRKEIST